MLLPFKETGRLLATLILQLLKKNITNKLRIRKTELELLEKFKKLEDSFTTQQKLKSTNSLEEKNLLLKQKQKEMQYLLPHLNLTNKRKIL